MTYDGLIAILSLFPSRPEFEVGDARKLVDYSSTTNVGFEENVDPKSYQID